MTATSSLSSAAADHPHRPRKPVPRHYVLLLALTTYIFWWLAHILTVWGLLEVPSHFSAAKRAGHPTSAAVFAAALLCNVITYHYVRGSNPGFLPSSDHSAADAAAQHDAVMEAGLGGLDDGDVAPVCPLCGADTAEDSKHCMYCNRCVDGFDHHCIWVGTCVGRRNHSRFWWFLFTQATAALLAFYQSIAAATVRGKSRRQVAIVVMLLLFMWCSLVPFVGLLAFHTYLAATNQTTRQFSHVMKGRSTGPRASMSHLPTGLFAVLDNCEAFCFGRHQRRRRAWFFLNRQVRHAVDATCATACSNRYYSCC